MLSNHLAIESQAGTLLHFAPEAVLAPKLHAARLIHDIRMDLVSARAIDVRGDLVHLPFKNESVDYVLCSHVLEHISDDVMAMMEIRRVLRQRGWALVDVPVRLDRPTVEDVTVTAPEERRRLFGHPEHVRYYGRDLLTRLESAGFDVDVVRAESNAQAEVNRYLCQGAVAFVCRPRR